MELLKCRLCLDDIDVHNMFDLFQANGKSSIALYAKVEYCCGVKVRQESEMPSKICGKCCDILDVAFNFRNMCQNTQKYLHSLTTNIEDNTEDTDDQHTPIKSTITGNTKSDYEHEPSECNEEPVMANEESSGDSNVPTQRLRSSETKSEDAAGKLPQKILKPTRKRHKVRSYMCSICGNLFSKSAQFHYHMNQHKEPTHECELCHKKFKQTCELKYHMRLHTGEKPYNCSYCDRRFIDLGGKVRHERTHTNERPYKCDLCDRTFLYSWSCKKHILIHTGEKPHSCNICNKSFTLMHQLKAHLETTTHKQKEARMGEMIKDEYILEEIVI